MRTMRYVAVAVSPLVLGACAGSPEPMPEASRPASDEAVDVETVAAPTHPELRRELFDLRARDQEARGKMVAAMQRATRTEDGRIQFVGEDAKSLEAVGAIDAESTAFLKAMVAQHGWPTYDMVGEDGARAAWLLAQHADADPSFQGRVLELMEPLVQEGQAPADAFALLTDRVLLARGEPQIYGTQFGGGADGITRPRPTADWSGVDARRASVGLEPTADYAERIKASYGGEVSLEPQSMDQLRKPE